MPAEREAREVISRGIVAQCNKRRLRVFLKSIRRSSESFRSAGSTPQGRLRLLPLSLDNGLNKEVALSSFWIFVSQRH